jgi:AsmA protein
MIPDTPIPFNVLRLADADVKLNVAQLKSGDAIYRAIATHLNLQDGKLQLDPVSADLPEGHLDAALRADATQASPPVALRLRIPALALQPLLAAMHEPAFISGNLNVQADLHGAGTTPHAIAASLDGSLGLSMAGGTVDNRILGSSLGSILREVNLLDMVGRGGTSQVQCFVARLDANHGIATVRSLVFASSLLTLDGDGSLNLGAETLDLHVRPQARVAGTGLVVPLRVTGPFRSPSASPDPTAAVTQNAGTVAGAVLSTTTPLGIVAGARSRCPVVGKQIAAESAPRRSATRRRPHRNSSRRSHRMWAAF